MPAVETLNDTKSDPAFFRTIGRWRRFGVDSARGREEAIQEKDAAEKTSD